MNSNNNIKDKITSRDIQAENRKNQFIVAAKELFAEKGYHGTTVRDINRAVGITEGLMYHYFPGGKSEILQAIVNNAIEEKKNNYNTALSHFEGPSTLKEVLNFFGSIIFDFTTKDKELILIWLRDKNLIDKKYQDEYADITENIIKHLIAYINTFVMQNNDCDLEPTMMANQFLSSLSMFIMQEYVSGMVYSSNNTQEDYLHSLVDYTLKTWRFKT